MPGWVKIALIAAAVTAIGIYAYNNVDAVGRALAKKN